MSTDSNTAFTSVFEERAENLSWDELRNWTTYTPRDEHLISKLMGTGAKLLTGPRGSGKSTLLKTAYFRLISSQDVLPVYVNYSRSLALEPLFHRRADAPQLFRQWVLLKIISAVAKSFNDADQTCSSQMATLAQRAEIALRAYESGALDSNLPGPYAPSQVLELLETAAEDFGCERSVLLMDDAAHAFSPDQQREFFEVFRELRSRRVSCKAAVYPGVTSYSPNVHVGHEAELLEAWSQPDDDEYLEGMRRLVQRRLPEGLASQLAEKQEIVDYLALAAFGLPRAFLNMLARVFEVDETDNARPTKLRAERVVASQTEETRSIFRSLSRKLPRFSKFVEVGEDLERSMISAIGDFNQLQSDIRRKAKVVALEHPLPPALVRILGMLEYAGIIRPAGTISRGEKGRFARYIVHYALLLSEGALKLGRNASLSDSVISLRNRHPHSFARAKVTTLIGARYLERCHLDLPACESCHAARISEDQRFCVRCGQELSNASIYEELLEASVSVLPLPEKKKEGILRFTTLRTVQDVILDDDMQQLRKVPGIGPVWARHVRTAAAEFAGV